MASARGKLVRFSLFKVQLFEAKLSWAQPLKVHLLKAPLFRLIKLVKTNLVKHARLIKFAKFIKSVKFVELVKPFPQSAYAATVLLKIYKSHPLLRLSVQTGSAHRARPQL
jgi:hypothetical protein